MVIINPNLCFSFAFDFPLLFTSQPQRQKATQRQKDYLCFWLSFAFGYSVQLQQAGRIRPASNSTVKPRRQKATQRQKQQAASSKQQAARQQGAWSREHGAWSREQGAWSREQGAGWAIYSQPITQQLGRAIYNIAQPAASTQPPSTQPPAPSTQPPAASSQQQQKAKGGVKISELI